MTVQGELTIDIELQSSQPSCKIVSSRPKIITNLFKGKPLTSIPQLIPLLFNLCSKAQTVTAIKAIESQLDIIHNKNTILQREILILLECLREYCLPVLMIWPNYIQQPTENKTLGIIIQKINQLTSSFQLEKLLNYPPTEVPPLSHIQMKYWQDIARLITKTIFEHSIEDWLLHTPDKLETWAKQKKTPTANFMFWLSQKKWKHIGKSTIYFLPPNIDEALFIKNLKSQQDEARYQWQNKCYEVSSLNYLQDTKLFKELTLQYSNSLYCRMWSRLISIAKTINELTTLFTTKTLLKKETPLTKGLAYSNTARGRLTHYIELDNNTVKEFFILAPTEWNFHPKGVAAKSLKNLNLQDHSSLLIQANMLIQAIDPCVGFKINIHY